MAWFIPSDFWLACGTLIGNALNRGGGFAVSNRQDRGGIKWTLLSDMFRGMRTQWETVLCPLHDDHDPSLGLMHDRGRPKVMLYHCLGCGSAGTVVRLHQRVESKYHNRELSAHDACMELCKLFDIPIPEQGVEEDDIEKQYQRKYAMIDKLSKGYTRKTFREELLENRRNGLDLEQAAFSAVKLIASEKRLYY